MAAGHHHGLGVHVMVEGDLGVRLLVKSKCGSCEP